MLRYSIPEELATRLLPDLQDLNLDLILLLQLYYIPILEIIRRKVTREILDIFLQPLQKSYVPTYIEGSLSSYALYL